MRNLIVFVLISLFGLSIHAQDLTCQIVGRAITTDQKSMANAIALGFFNIPEKLILSAGTSEYISWKGEQVGCLADVIHYAKVTVLEKRGEEVCQTELDLHTKDYFAGRRSFEREYKPRNIETNCFKPKGELGNQIKTCSELPSCPNSRDGLLTRDIFKNCECSFLYDKLTFDDVQEDYEGFFNPNLEFNKPEDLYSPF